jgi:hypothetical protein
VGDGTQTYYQIDGVGTFSFDLGTVINADGQIPHPPGDQEVIDAMLSWEWDKETDLGEIKFYEEWDTTGTSGSLDFSNPVQIIVAKWGQGQSDQDSWAFLLDGYTTHFDWNLSVQNGMSHVDGYNAVPIPAAVWLLGSGVLGLVAVRRRRS